MSYAFPASADRASSAVYEHGSLTRAAEELGYAQPSVSEQVRALEKSLGVQLFRRVGRGVVPTTVADTLRPHAERTLAAAEETRRAAQAVKSFETGTIRFGMFGTARLYAGAGLVADVLARHPGVRVELVGQNSTEVAEELRRGRLEAAMIAIALGRERGHAGHAGRAATRSSTSATTRRGWSSPVTAKRLAEATLVMPETTWRATDSIRIMLRQMLHETGRNPPTRIEVEDVEIAVELVGMGLADTVIPRGAAEQLLPRLAPERRLGVAAPPALRHLRDRAPPRGHPLPRRPADDRARHQADPGDRPAASGR